MAKKRTKSVKRTSKKAEKCDCCKCMCKNCTCESKTCKSCGCNC